MTQLLLQRWRLNARDGALFAALSRIRCNARGPGPEHFAYLADLWRKDANKDAYNAEAMRLADYASVFTEFFKLHGQELRHVRTWLPKEKAEVAGAMIRDCPELSALSLLSNENWQDHPGPLQWLANAKSLRRLRLESGMLALRLIPDEMHSTIEALELEAPTAESLALLAGFTALKELLVFASEFPPLSSLGVKLPADLVRLEGVHVAKEDVPQLPATLRTLKLGGDAPALSAALKRLPQLFELTLSQAFTQKHFEHLGEYVRRQDCQLRVLKLRDVGKTKVSMENLASALADNHSLEELHLAGVSLNQNAWPQLAKVIAKGRLRVLHLNLNKRKLTSAEFNPLLDAIENSTSLCSLTGQLSHYDVAIDEALELRLRRFAGENRSIAHVELQIRWNYRIKFDNLAYMDKPASKKPRPFQ